MNAFTPKPYTFDRVIRIAITLAVFWGLITLMQYLSTVLIPFAIAILLAYLLEPLVTRIQKLIKNRVAAILTTLVVVGGLVVLGAGLLIPLIMHEVGHMGELLTKVANDEHWGEQIQQFIPPDILKAIQEFAGREDIQSLFSSESFLKMANSVVQKVLPGVWGVFKGVTNLIIALLGFTIILLYLIFILIDYDKMADGWKGLIPESYRHRIVGVVQDFEEAMNKYFRAQALIATLVGIMFATGFAIIGLPMGIALGLFIGLLNMVPYLQVIGFIPALFMALMYSLETGGSFWVMSGLIGVVYIVVQGIQDGILVPKIMGKVTGLNPAVQLLALSIWGQLLGLLGLLIALPLTYLLFSYYKRFLAINEKVVLKRKQEAVVKE